MAGFETVEDGFAVMLQLTSLVHSEFSHASIPCLANRPPQ